MQTRSFTWSRRDWGFLALFTLGVLFIFRQVLFNPDVVLFGVDVLEQHYMFEKYVREGLAAGRLPFWNPYIFSGMPALSHPQYMVFYPGQMLLRWLPLNLAISWTQVIHVWLGGVGMMILGRKLKLNSWVAFTCALVFVLNSGMMQRIHAGHVWLVYALCWLPWAWLLSMVVLETGKFWAIAAGAIVVCFIVLTGHPTYPAYILLFLGFYWAFVIVKSWRRHRSWSALFTITGRFLLMIGLGVGLSAIQLVPSVVMQREISLSGGYSAEIANFLALQPAELWGFVVPGVYASADRQLFFWESVPYLGVLFLFLIPFAFFSQPRRRGLALFLSLVALFALLLAMGDSAGIYPWLQSVAPVFQILRIPPRALVLWIPAVTLIGGIGLQTLADQEVAPKWLRIWLGIYLLLAMVMAAVWLGWRLNPTSMTGVIPAVMSDTLSSGLLLLVMLILIVVFLCRNLAVYGHAPFSVVPVIVLVCLDPGFFGAGHILAATPPQYQAQERVMLEPEELAAHERILTPQPTNSYMLGEVQHIYGYNSGNLGRYEQFLGVVAGTISTDFLVGLDARKLDFLGVGRLISTVELNEQLVDRQTIAGDMEETTYHHYRNEDVVPRAFIVGEVTWVANRDEAEVALASNDFDFRESVVLEGSIANQIPAGPEGASGPGEVRLTGGDRWTGRVEMAVTMDRPGVLVLSEPYYPERKYLVNGEVQPALVANMAFNAVFLPEGDYEVVLFYDPRSFQVGIIISLLCLLLIGALVMMKFVRRRWKRESIS